MTRRDKRLVGKLIRDNQDQGPPCSGIGARFDGSLQRIARRGGLGANFARDGMIRISGRLPPQSVCTVSSFRIKVCFDSKLYGICRSQKRARRLPRDNCREEGGGAEKGEGNRIRPATTHSLSRHLISPCATLPVHGSSNPHGTHLGPSCCVVANGVWMLASAGFPFWKCILPLFKLLYFFIFGISGVFIVIDC